MLAKLSGGGEGEDGRSRRTSGERVGRGKAVVVPEEEEGKGEKRETSAHFFIALMKAGREICGKEATAFKDIQGLKTEVMSLKL